MVDFIHNNKDLYGVDAICRILPIAASTYYRTLDLADNPEHRAKRDLHDEHHAEQIKRIWKESSGRYGVRKVWQKLKREGYVIARCTVARLMQNLEIQGVWRGKNTDIVLDALSYVSSFELEAMYDYKINQLGQMA